MTSAYFTIGSKCNHSCIFCPCKWEQRNKEIDVSVFEERIQELEAQKHIHSITLSGGEPTIQHNFFDLLKCVVKTRLDVLLLTNSDRLSDPKLVSQIKEILPPERLQITTALHSNSPEIHDAITGCHGSFQRTNLGLHQMLDAGYTINLKFCISRLNYQQLPDFMDYYFASFPDSVSLNICSIDYCGRADLNTAKVEVSFREVRSYLEQALDKVMQYENAGQPRNVIVTNTPLCCVSSKYWEYFICDSKKNTDAFLPLPTEGPDQILYNNASGSGTYFEACRHCDVEPYCPGAWYSTYKLFGEHCVTPIHIHRT